MAAVLGFFIEGAVGIGLALSIVPTYAATTVTAGSPGIPLTPDATAIIQGQLSKALAGVDSRSTGEAKAQAIETAVTQIVEGAVITYGAGTAGAIASTVIVSTLDQPANSIGAGLCVAAAHLATTQPDAARAIARTVANEGTQNMGVACAEAITAAGGPLELAEIATSPPEVTGSTGGPSGGPSGGLGGSALPPPPPPCGNPSCT